jgi:pimeloyl-ACP methyl ester carboxylesterase
MSLLRTEETEVDGHRLRFAKVGRGTPLLLLHGYPDTLQIWSRLAPLLAEQYQVIAFDWPGIGGSDPWPGGASPFDLGRRIVRLLDHWGLERAVIAGHDMGGQAALAAATLAPSRVERLIVMSSLVLWDERTSWEISLLRRFRLNRWLLLRMPRLVFARAVVTSLPRGESLPRELRDELWSRFRQRSSREFIVRMCAGYEGTLPRLAALYPNITTPTLVLWGERDRHFPLRHGERLQQMLPNATMQVLPDAEHWMVWSRAADVARALLDYEFQASRTAAVSS